MQTLGPITLEGRTVRLEPLRLDHLPALCEVAAAPEIWATIPFQPLDQYVAEVVRAAELGLEYAVAVVLQESGRVVGCTRYTDIQGAHKGVEIGFTWYAPAVWGTKVNPECKYLLLQHAFEDWGALRVQLRTNDLNLRSQAAIRKLGAKYEGRLRNHRVRPDGTVRDTLMFSIVADEWPAVKAGLRSRLEA